MPRKNTAKRDTTITVAVLGLIGTIVTALIASPLFPKLLGREDPVVTEIVTTVVVTAESSGEAPRVRKESLVFSNDFSSGNASGFAFSNDTWEVGKEKNNQLLEMRGLDSDALYAAFGPNDFTDGMILFRINFRNLDDFSVNFRSTLDVETYSLLFTNEFAEIGLGYRGVSNDWSFDPFANGIRGFQFAEAVWYEVKFVADGEQMTVWVDDNKVLTSTDPRLRMGQMEFVEHGNGTVWLDDVEVWEYTYEPQ